MVLPEAIAADVVAAGWTSTAPISESTIVRAVMMSDCCIGTSEVADLQQLGLLHRQQPRLARPRGEKLGVAGPGDAETGRLDGCRGRRRVGDGATGVASW